MNVLATLMVARDAVLQGRHAEYTALMNSLEPDFVFGQTWRRVNKKTVTMSDLKLYFTATALLTLRNRNRKYATDHYVGQVTATTSGIDTVEVTIETTPDPTLRTSLGVWTWVAT